MTLQVRGSNDPTIGKEPISEIVENRTEEGSQDTTAAAPEFSQETPPPQIATAEPFEHEEQICSFGCGHLEHSFDGKAGRFKITPQTVRRPSLEVKGNSVVFPDSVRRDNHPSTRLEDAERLAEVA